MFGRYGARVSSNRQFPARKALSRGHIQPRRRFIAALLTRSGDIVLLHQTPQTFAPSAYFLTGPETRGHKDVVRALHHDTQNQAIYTGSEDGVLSGWSLASMGRLVVGDQEIDDDGGDGREDIDSDNEEDEESEIETESSGDGMDVDEDEEESGGPRNGPIIGGGRGGEGRKEKRRMKRTQPY